MKLSKKILNGIICIVIIIVMASAAIYDWNSVNSYQSYNTDTLSYARAKVLSVESEQLAKDEFDQSRYLGTQDIKVKILSGKYKNKEYAVVNNLSRTQNIKVVENQIIIACVDAPKDASIYVSVYNYYRFPIILIMFALFAVIVLWIGKKKGVRALAGLMFTVFIILVYMVQAIYHGQSPVWTAALTVTLTGTVSLFLLNGWKKKTAAAILSTICGILCTAMVFFVFQYLMNISGYNLADAESLVLISQSTGLSIKNMIFAGVLVSALGAVMDVAMSIASALQEVNFANENLTRKQLFSSGINIGKDMIGTMSNTLILAYTGTALTTMLLLIAYGYQSAQLLNSNYLAIEILQGLASTMGVVLTVPMASFVSAFIYKYNTYKEGEKK